jgi:hypothetical protein
MGYYLVKWLSEPYTLQKDTEGMSGMIPVGSMVVDGLYFNRVQGAPLWYTSSSDTMVVEVKNVLRTGLQLQPLSMTNALPNACARIKAMLKKAVTVSTLDHEVIMEEATKHNRKKRIFAKKTKKQSKNQWCGASLGGPKTCKM